MKIATCDSCQTPLVLLAQQGDLLKAGWCPHCGSLRFLRQIGSDEAVSTDFKQRWQVYAKLEGFTPLVFGGEP